MMVRHLVFYTNLDWRLRQLGFQEEEVMEIQEITRCWSWKRN
jgi:hypothetical protein